MKKFLLILALMPFTLFANITPPPEPEAGGAPPAPGYLAPIENKVFILLSIILISALVFMYIRKLNFNK